MVSKIAVFLVFLLQKVCADVDDKYLNSDHIVAFDPIEYIESHGYRAEHHQVVTEDGYILGLFRVRSPRYDGQWLQPVLLQHGFLCTGLIWVVGAPGGGFIEIETVNYDSGEKKRVFRPSANLGFVLADRGYDVWLANSRGNTYSTNHTTLDPFADHKFWDYSIQELALKDLPATIHHVIKHTGAQKLGFVGHSQGTLMTLWLLAEKPEISNLLQPVVLLAPIADSSQFDTPIRIFFDHVITKALQHHPGPLLSQTIFLDTVIKSFCRTRGVSDICLNLLQFLGQLGSPQINTTRIPILAAAFPAGISRKDFTHYSQASEKGFFTYYDEGIENNMRLYGRPDPPRVQFDRINCTTIAAFSSADDSFATEEEVRIFGQLLKVRLMDSYQVPYHLFSHMDFVWGKEAGLLVNQRILTIMDNFFKTQPMGY